MDPSALADRFALLAGPDRARLVLALLLGLSIMGAAVPRPRRRATRPPPEPILRLRRPDLPWRLTRRGPVEVPPDLRPPRRAFRP